MSSRCLIELRPFVWRLKFDKLSVHLRRSSEVAYLVELILALCPDEALARHLALVLAFGATMEGVLHVIGHQLRFQL